MPKPRRWIITPAGEPANRLAEALKTNPLLAQVLINRGIADPESARQFLNPSLRLLHEPGLIEGLELASRRMVQAIKQQQRIVIYGDYDVDGITASSILWHAVRALGGRAEYYIPHRLDEGYGLNSEAITQLCDSGAQLIVTVDCGITAIEQAAICLAKGVDLIITDHHEWRHDESVVPRLPQGCLIVHPRLPNSAGDTYPNPNLCGAGVAFKLAWGMGLTFYNSKVVDEKYRAVLLEALGLAALGTIADVVPLTGENRLLAHFGLGSLPSSKLIGIKALIESAGLTGKDLDAYDVGFKLGPRLNACGRMGHAKQAVEMLTDASAERAAETANYLEEQNRIRQTKERQIFEQAMEQALKLGYDRDDARGVVLAAPGWHAGIIGIVASRVVGELHKPTIMVALENGEGHGSGRSISGFHLARALDACHCHLETHGGHEMAAGLKLLEPRLEAFRDAFMAHAAEHVTDDMLAPQLRLDCQASLRQISMALVADFKRVGPFGMANRRPLICCPDVELAAAPRRVGQAGKHVQLQVRQDGASMKCIAFGQGDLADRLRAGSRVDLAAEPGINEYNGYRNVELEVVEVRERGE